MFNIDGWKITSDDKGNLVFLHINLNTNEHELVKIVKIPKSHKKRRTTLQKLKDFGNKLGKKKVI